MSFTTRVAAVVAALVLAPALGGCSLSFGSKPNAAAMLAESKDKLKEAAELQREAREKLISDGLSPLAARAAVDAQMGTQTSRSEPAQAVFTPAEAPATHTPQTRNCVNVNGEMFCKEAVTVASSLPAPVINTQPAVVFDAQRFENRPSASPRFVALGYAPAHVQN